MTEFELKFLGEENLPTLEEIKEKYNCIECGTHLKSIEDLKLLVGYDGDEYDVVDTVLLSNNGFINEARLYNDMYVDHRHLFLVSNPEEFVEKANTAKEYVNITNFKNFVKRIIPILDIVYPENYDIQYDIQAKRLDVLIRFKNITITNSNGSSKQIENLYVNLRFYYDYGHNSIRLENFRGFKSTYSLQDFSTGYCHSHLHRREHTSLFRPTNFCTGSTSITVTISDFSSGTITDEAFEVFLYDLENYVSWESLEGTPYIKMDTTNYYNISPTSTNAITKAQITESIEKYFINGTIKPVIDISIINGDTEVLIQNEQELLVELGKHSIVKGILNINGKLEPVTRYNKDLLRDRYNEAFSRIEFKTFRNEEIKYEIQQQEDEQEGEYPHPEIFEQFKRDIREKVRECFISEQFQNLSYPEHLEQNLVLV